MSEYIRMLSYIYSYEDDRKNKNVGFAKMDGRNGLVRLLINIRGGYRNDMRNLRLYFFRQKNNDIVPVEVGEIRLINGNCEYRTEMRAEDVTESIGFYIVSVDNEEQEKLEFASCFRDRDKGIAYFREKVMKKANLLDEEMPINNIEPEIEAESVEDTIQTDRLVPEYWDKLSRKYPKCRILDSKYDCIRINVEDVGNLPEEYWKLTQNSFLLQSYYFHRHLLMVFDRECGEYYIGVQGHYQRNEQIAAAMFGFDKYMQCKQTNPDGIGVGYWMMNLPALN